MKKIVLVFVAALLAGCGTNPTWPLTESATASPRPTSAPAVQTVVVEKVVTAMPLPLAATNVPSKCRVIHDYNLDWDMDHVSSGGTQLHVEYWWEGQPERETFLPTVGVAGGRYNLTRSLRGHVWEYADCSDAEVGAQIDAHIPRRLAGGANNAGFIDWSSTGLFRPAK